MGADAEARGAKVIVVDKVIDAASNSFRVRLELPNPNQSLPPGLRCKVEFDAGAAAADNAVPKPGAQPSADNAHAKPAADNARPSRRNRCDNAHPNQRRTPRWLR